MAGETICIERLTPLIGAAMRGVGLAQPLDDETFEVIHHVFTLGGAP